MLRCDLVPVIQLLLSWNPSDFIMIGWNNQYTLLLRPIFNIYITYIYYPWLFTDCICIPTKTAGYRLQFHRSPFSPLEPGLSPVWPLHRLCPLARVNADFSRHFSSQRPWRQAAEIWSKLPAAIWESSSAGLYKHGCRGYVATYGSSYHTPPLIILITLNVGTQ